MDGALLLVLRILFVIATASTAYQISVEASGTPPFSWTNFTSILIGTSIAVGIIWVEMKYAARFILGAFTVILGLLVGFIASYLFTKALFLLPHMRVIKEGIRVTLFSKIEDALQVCITFFFCYMSVAILFRTRNRFKLLIPFVDLTSQKTQDYLILDTSVIIDGRIINLCDNNILRGTIVLPKFVLNELQMIADSPDKLKRVRGRRGLEMLAELKNRKDLEIHLDEELFPKIKEVDEKLIALSQKLHGMLVTNDYNLKKIAELYQVEVINLNVVANSLRPPVLPGDQLSIRIIRKGEESNQGIGYLKDGTVVVVENGFKLIGSTVDVIVTNILQTNVGRMVFGKPGTSHSAK